MLQYTFNISETIAIGVILLIIGGEIKKRVPFFKKFFIPSPVIGGILFSCITLVGYQTQSFSFSFDTTISALLLTGFFTTVGFSASAKVLAIGGVKIVYFLFVATLLALFQNVLGVFLAQLFNLHPLIGVAAGSTSMTGGPAIAVAFGPLLEAAGAQSAYTVSIASATFGLVAGGLIGGPVAWRLMVKNKIAPVSTDSNFVVENTIDNKEDTVITEKSIFYAVFVITIAMGVGSLVSKLWGNAITLPAHIGPMLIAVLIRNIADHYNITLPTKEISIIGVVSLAIFLALALMTIKLWELAGLALPLLVILLSQVVLTACFVYFITYKIMGKNYDSIVISAGHCGFGLGSTPNAMANMSTFTSTHGPSPVAFFVVPLIGGFFIDLTNSILITLFINFF